MYVYYEHHKDAAGKIVLTELRVSSDRNGVLEIRFWNPIEKMTFEALKPVLKFPPLSNYSYSPELKLWSYFGQVGVTGTYGEEVIKKIEAVVKALGEKFAAFAVEDLADQCVNNRVDLNRKPKKKMSAEEFFYNHGQPVAAPVMSKQQLEEKLVAYLGSTEISKKSYRLAAMRLHPDRPENKGSSAAMTELNFLWQQWNTLSKETTNV